MFFSEWQKPMFPYGAPFRTNIYFFDYFINFTNKVQYSHVFSPNMGLLQQISRP